MPTSWQLKVVGSAIPRKSHLNLLGKDYVVAVPGSALAEPRALANTSETASVDPDVNVDDRSVNEAMSASEPANQQRNLAKPPIEFVTAPIDYKTQDVREEPPLDFVTELSSGIIAPVARGHGVVSRCHSLARSPSGSERLSETPQSERSALSVRETVISSTGEQGFSRESLKMGSRATSPSSLAEWSGGSLDRHGELSIAALSLGEGRNMGGLSRRTDLTSAQSPARSETQVLNYSPDDTDSGVEMYHETTSASPGSYSGRSSCSVSEGWISEFEDSDGVSHEYRRSKQRNSDHLSKSFSSSRSQSGSARYSLSSSTHRNNRGQHSPNNTLRKFVSNKQFLDTSPSGKVRHHGDYYEYKGNLHPGSSNFPSRRHSTSQKRRDDSNSKVAFLLDKYGHKKENLRSSGGDMVALDSLTPQEAIAVFHDEVARMMDEEGEECVEAKDIEEFLDGYMRLRSPFYLSMVDEFFRAVCVDCYKRPVEIPDDGRSGSSSRSLRSDSQLYHFHNVNLRM